MKISFCRSLAVIFLAAGASACGSGATTGETSGGPGGPGSTGGASGGTPDQCVIDASMRLLIQETVREQTLAARDVALNSATKQRGFAVHIPGSDGSYVGFSPLVVECPHEPIGPRCNSTAKDPIKSDFFTQESHDACVIYSCDKGSKTMALVDTYMTMKPKTSATDRHKFTYKTVVPDGAAIYDPNPFFTWRIDLTDPDAIKVSADIDANVKITPKEGSLFDFKHKGTVTAVRGGNLVESVELELEFTGLFQAGDPPITASATLDSAVKAAGSVKNGDAVIAEITPDFGFEWKGDCAPAP